MPVVILANKSESRDAIGLADVRKGLNMDRWDSCGAPRGTAGAVPRLPDGTTRGSGSGVDSSAGTARQPSTSGSDAVSSAAGSATESAVSGAHLSTVAGSASSEPPTASASASGRELDVDPETRYERHVRLVRGEVLTGLGLKEAMDFLVKHTDPL